MSQQQPGSGRTTVYVSNLPRDVTDKEVRKLFEKYGKIVRAMCQRDRLTRKRTGLAFVLFANAKEAEKSCESLNDVEIFGRILKVSIAKDNGKVDKPSRKRKHPDIKRCLYCGGQGHISNMCPLFSVPQ